MTSELKCHKLDTPEQVFFYEQDFYVLSNFSAFTVKWKGIRFDTSEAAYHWEKFPNNPDIQYAIQHAPSAHEAFKIAGEHSTFRRDDWDDVKRGIMKSILIAKVTQHDYVLKKLLDTGDRELVEDSWRDDYWGWGPNKDGQNMLGKVWMEVREIFQGLEDSTGVVSHRELVERMRKTFNAIPITETELFSYGKVMELIGEEKPTHQLIAAIATLINAGYFETKMCFKRDNDTLDLIDDAQVQREFSLGSIYDPKTGDYVPTGKLIPSVSRCHRIKLENEIDVSKGLPRYGIRHNGPDNPIVMKMNDGYWTPWHIADALINQAKLGECDGK